MPKVQFPGHYKRCTLSESEVDSLKVLYSTLYSPSLNSEMYVNTTFSQHSSVVYNDTVLGSNQSCSQSSSIVIAEWNSRLLGPPSESDHELRPVKINFLLKHTVIISGVFHTHLLASVSWFKHHPQKMFVGNQSLYGSLIFTKCLGYIVLFLSNFLRWKQFLLLTLLL